MIEIKQNGPNTPESEAPIDKLRAFCQEDGESVIASIPTFLQWTKDDREKAREWLMNIRPVVIIPPDQLREFEKVNLSLLDPDTLAVDSDHGDLWFEFRHAQADIGKLPKITAALETIAPRYAREIYDSHQTTQSAGYPGFIAMLKAGGYTNERMTKLFRQLNGLKQTHVPSISSAAELGRQELPGIEPLVKVPQMNDALTKHLGESQLTEVVYPEYPPTRGTASLHAKITSNNNAELRVFLVRGEKINPDVEVHEKAHILMAIDLARKGLVPSAVAPFGIQEAFARLAGGMSIREALFFGSCMEDSYRLAQAVDEIMQRSPSKQEATASISAYITRNTETEDFATGLKPIPGSGAFPFGPFMVPYIADAIESLSLRNQVSDQGISSPEALLNLVEEHYKIEP